MYCHSTNGTHFNGKFETMEECLSDARECADGSGFNVGVVVPLNFEEIAVKILAKIDFSEMMREEIEEIIGDDMDMGANTNSVARFSDHATPILTELLRSTYAGCFAVEEIEWVTR